MKLLGEFIIEELPKTINRSSGTHWSLRHKERIKWQRLVSEQCLLHALSELALESAVLTLTRMSSKEPDFDNLVSSFKPIIDSLVKCNVIIDDKPSVIGQSKFLWEYRQRKLGGSIRVKVEG